MMLKEWYVANSVTRFSLSTERVEGNLIEFPLTVKGVMRVEKAYIRRMTNIRMNPRRFSGCIRVDDVLIRFPTDTADPHTKTLRKAVDLINSGEVQTLVVRAKMTDEKDIWIE